MKPQTSSLHARATAALYGSGSPSGQTGGNMNQVDNSFWLPRIRDAKSRDNHILAARLEAQRKEFLSAAAELGLSPDQARRASIVLRDTAARPTGRDRLTESEELTLQRKHGSDVQRLVARGYQLVGKALEGKPALQEAVRAGGAWVHGEVADVLAELAAATPGKAA